MTTYVQIILAHNYTTPSLKLTDKNLYDYTNDGLFLSHTPHGKRRRASGGASPYVPACYSPAHVVRGARVYSKKIQTNLKGTFLLFQARYDGEH